MFFTGVPVLETPLLWFVDLQFSEEEILLKFSPTPPSSGSSWMCHWCRGEHCVYQHFRPKFGGKTRTLHKIALIDQLRAVFFHRKANLKRLKEREIPNSCRGRVWPRAMSSVRNRERKEHNDQWCSVRYSRCEVLGKRSSCGVSGGGIWQSSDPGMCHLLFILSPVWGWKPFLSPERWQHHGPGTLSIPAGTQN